MAFENLVEGHATAILSVAGGSIAVLVRIKQLSQSRTEGCIVSLFQIANSVLAFFFYRRMDALY